MRAAACLLALAAAVAPQAARPARADEKAKALVFRWDAVEGAAEYAIEISEDRDFARVVVRERVKSNYYRWQSLARRSYYWRVKAIEAGGREGKFSETRVIGAVVTAPALREPARGAKVAWGDQAPRVTLRWDASDLVARYRVDVALDASFQQGVTTEETQGAELVFTPTQPGAWHWRVGGVDSNGDPVPASAAWSFEVAATAPEPTAPAAGAQVQWDQDDLSVPLAWSARPVRAYTVEVARDKKFKRGVSRQRADTASIPFHPGALGDYVWRVRGADPQTEWSREGSFSLVMAVPAAAAPADGASIAFHGDAGTVELAWRAVPRATGYLVAVTPDAGGTVVNASVQTPSAQVALPAGAYTWTVRAQGEGNSQSAPSPPRRFTLARAAETPPPAVVAPPPAVTVVTPAPPVVVIRAAPRPAPRSSVTIAPSAGVFVHPGSLVALTVGVEAAVHLRRRLRVVGAARWFTSSTSASDGSLDARGRFHAVPFTLAALYEISPFYAGAGASLAIIQATVSADTQPDLSQRSYVAGALAIAGFERRLGGGQIYVEAAYTISQSTGGIARVDPSGLTALLGYRLWIW